MDTTDITDMCDRIDDRLIPLTRYEGFTPCEGIYRLGEDGYVTEKEFTDAFDDQPDWAADAYMLAGNGMDPDDIAAAHNEDPDGFEDWASLMFYDGGYDEAVFYTEATEDGTC